MDFLKNMNFNDPLVFMVFLVIIMFTTRMVLGSYLSSALIGLLLVGLWETNRKLSHIKKNVNELVLRSDKIEIAKMMK